MIKHSDISNFYNHLSDCDDIIRLKDEYISSSRGGCRKVSFKVLPSYNCFCIFIFPEEGFRSDLLYVGEKVFTVGLERLFDNFLRPTTLELENFEFELGLPYFLNEDGNLSETFLEYNKEPQ